MSLMFDGYYMHMSLVPTYIGLGVKFVSNQRKLSSLIDGKHVTNLVFVCATALFIASYSCRLFPN